MNQLGSALNFQAEVALETDRERAIAIFREADAFTWEGVHGLVADPRSGTPESKRQGLENMINVYLFWDGIAPGNGWAERAAWFQAQLDEMRGDTSAPGDG